MHLRHIFGRIRIVEPLYGDEMHGPQVEHARVPFLLACARKGTAGIRDTPRRLLIRAVPVPRRSFLGTRGRTNTTMSPTEAEARTTELTDI